MFRKIIKFTGQTRRLDSFVAEKIPVISREFAKKIIKTGMVFVNDKINLKPSTFLSPGDEITVKIAEPETKSDFPKNILIYEDNDILVISKPSGLIVHPNDSNWEKFPNALLMGEDSVMSVVLNARPEIINSKIPRFGLVHRLDRDTSGVMVLAKNRTSMNRISEQFRKRKIIKTYWGLVRGKVAGKTGLIEIPIGRPSGSKKIKAWEYGRRSITQFKLIAPLSEKYALLEIYPRTGRTNQIRVHLSYAGHPIVGDEIYGGEKAERMLLHSKKISFIHPSKRRLVSFTAPLPEDFISAVQNLDIDEKILKSIL